MITVTAYQYFGSFWQKLKHCAKVKSQQQQSHHDWLKARIFCAQHRKRSQFGTCHSNFAWFPIELHHFAKIRSNIILLKKNPLLTVVLQLTFHLFSLTQYQYNTIQTQQPRLKIFAFSSGLFQHFTYPSPIPNIHFSLLVTKQLKVLSQNNLTHGIGLQDFQKF